MADYTTNTGIIKPTAGEYPNTWGAKANTNFDIFDRALGGRTTITKASGGANVYGVDYPVTLAVSDGALSDGQYPAIEYADDGDLGADLYVQLTPSDAKRTITFKNSLTNDRSLVIYQGEYNSGRAYIVPNGYDATLVFSGGGSTAATVTRLVEKQALAELDTESLKISGEAIGNLTWPVDSIFISISSENPGVTMGFGTWVRFAEGKTIFSQSGAITALDTAEETGGSVTIAANNLPEHAHDFSGTGTLPDHVHDAGSYSINDLYPQQTGKDGSTGSVYSGSLTSTQNTVTGYSGSPQTSSADTTVPAIAVTGTTDANTTTAADYYPPYIVVYMWKRTA